MKQVVISTNCSCVGATPNNSYYVRFIDTQYNIRIEWLNVMVIMVLNKSLKDTGRE